MFGLEKKMKKSDVSKNKNWKQRKEL